MQAPPEPSTWFLLYLTCLTSYGPTSSAMFSSSLQKIQSDLGASKSEASTAVSWYLLSGAVGPLLLGHFGDIYGRRMLLRLVLAVTVGTMFVCVFVNSFLFLVWTKVVQGFFITSVGAAAVGMVSDVFTTNRGVAMGKILMGGAFAPVVGPIIGGIIVQYWSWRVIFLLMASIGVMYLIIAQFYIKETVLTQKPKPFTSIGLVLNPKFLVYGIPAGLLWGFEYFLMKELSYLFIVHYKFSRIMTGILYLPLGIGIALGSVVGGRVADRFGSNRGLLVILLVPFIIVAFGTTATLSLTITLVILFFLGFCVSSCNSITHVLITLVFQDQRAAAIGSLRFMSFAMSFILIEGGKQLENRDIDLYHISLLYALMIFVAGIPVIFLSIRCQDTHKNDTVLWDIKIQNH